MPAIFEPVSFGTLYARNRLVRAATYERMCSSDGTPTQGMISLYGGLSAGGAGTIITSFCAVRDDEYRYSRMLGLWDDSQIDAHRPLVDAVHAHGAAAVLQLVHCGSGIYGRDFAEPAPGPSDGMNPSTGVPMRTMDARGLATMARSFANAARRAKEAGYDGVELHAAHGYLLGQFLSPNINMRDDEYGGSIANRTRFIAEVITSVRAEVGEGYPIFMKINSSDGSDGGLAEEDSLAAAELLAPGLDAVEASGSGWRTARIAGPKGVHGLYAGYAERLAGRVETPIILTGGNRVPSEMQDLLDGAGIQGFGMARPLVCEPDLPNKWMDDRAYSARCVSCSRCFSWEDRVCVLHEPAPRE